MREGACVMSWVWLAWARGCLVCTAEGTTVRVTTEMMCVVAGLLFLRCILVHSDTKEVLMLSLSTLALPKGLVLVAPAVETSFCGMVFKERQLSQSGSR